LLEFEPQSHLRDFEVLDPFSTNEKTIPRWGAIGQICIAAFQMHIRLFATGRSQNEAHLEVDVSLFNHTKECREIISEALGLGWDIMFVRGMFPYTTLTLCEKVTKEDARGNTVFLPHLNSSVGEPLVKRDRTTPSPSHEDDDVCETTVKEPPAKRCRTATTTTVTGK